MKFLLWISLIIAIVIAFYELIAWADESSLAWVIIALALAVVFQAVYLLAKPEKKGGG